MTTTCTMILGDCLEVMPTLAKSSVSMAFADLPYGVSNLAWDTPIDYKSLWQAWATCSSDHAVFLATAVQPFASVLVAGALKRFRHDIVWLRKNSKGFLNAKRAPLRKHEHILIFGTPPITYNPSIERRGQDKKIGIRTPKRGYYAPSVYGGYYQPGKVRHEFVYPTSTIAVDETDIRQDTLNGHIPARIHPTQKPIALIDSLIRTYSNAGELVLDPTAGSFTTCVSACSNGRSSVGIERDEGYFEASVERVRKHIRDNLLDVKLEVRK